MEEKIIEHVAVGIGEILWDLLPSGKMLGGAPANFAYQLNSLGISSYPISSIGRDDLGEEIISVLKSNSLSSKYIQLNPNFDTGIVNVKLDENGKPSYKIIEDVAWDNINLTSDLVSLAKKTSAICFGSLAQRNVESQNTIQEILCETPSDCIRVFDINLRQNYYSELVIDQSLKIASVLKLNDEELPIVGSTFGFTGSDESILSQLLANYNLNLIALTKGAQGSLLFLPTTESILEPTKTKIIDTVGAGDAFTAGLVYGLLNDYDISHIHRIASNLATFVCSKNGATPRLNGEQKKFIINS